MKNLFLCIILSVFSMINSSFGQLERDSSKMVMVTTMDGKERVGYILEDNGREILLMTESIGKIYINKMNIESIVDAANVDMEEYNGDYRNSGPFTTRYYFTTNALPVKKSEDYAMIHLYGPEVHFSVANNFSIGIMTTWIASPFVLALKYSIPTKNEKVNLGLGTLLGTSGYLNTFRGFGGLHWGMLTIGDRMRNITISGGISYADAGFSSMGANLGTAPVASIAAISKVGKKSSFIFDSMVFFPLDSDIDAFLYLMPGMRFQKGPDNAFQFALAGVTAIEGSNVLAFPAPMCSWFFKF